MMLLKNLDHIFSQDSLLSSLIKLVVFPCLLLTLFLAISLDPTLWVSSEIHHFYIELIAVILGSALSFYYILRYRVLRDRFSLFVGIGFFISVSIDLFHVVVSFALIENISFIKYFIPQTWFAGRFFLGAMLLIAILKYSSVSPREEIEQLSDVRAPSYTREEENEQKAITEKKDGMIFYISILGIIAIVTAVSSLFLVYPSSVLDDYSVHRPYEIPPLILFCLVLFFFYKKKLYQKKDVVYKGLALYLVIDIFTQVVMAFSAMSFDTAHNMAHVLKDVGYFVNIIALIMSSMQYSAYLKKANSLIKENLKKLQENEKLKDDFINIAAHELRTPIQPILGLSDLINHSLQNDTSEIDKSELKSDMKVIYRNAKKLQKLTNDILDVSRIDSHILNLNTSRFDFVELIKNTIEDFTTNSEKKEENVYIDFDLRDETKSKEVLDQSILIEGDKTRISQVLLNLLNNARKFTEEGKITVTVLIKKDAKEVIVSISDSGKGINSEVMNHLFEKFISRSDSGTGLGLYISKNIIEAHRGKIWASNNQNGIGSTFSFSIPVETRSMTESEPKPEPKPNAGINRA
ncbi:Sensor protein DivL [Candidatus Nitrosocosmicus oleophilus]|uniref:histidine kinase n=1 Tax=Candidatus Nitrosocosmicus oleophilus TaxID=1353260 RepID=A0A654LX25_9ARCH|nr:Sensor protein DivL [Candidatus Nitrosocosmicus oleophilus]